MRHLHRLTTTTLTLTMILLLLCTAGCAQGASGTPGNESQTTSTGAFGGPGPAGSDQQQAAPATHTIAITGTVTRSIQRSAAGGPLAGDETIVVNGSMVMSQQPNESSWLRGSVEGQVTFIGVQKVKHVGNFNATYNGSASMGDISVQPSGTKTTTTVKGQLPPTNPFAGAPPLLAPWNGGTGTISLSCQGTGTAEYKGNTAPMPDEWDTSLNFVIWVSTSGQIAIQVTDPTVKSGGLTASYQ